MNPEDLTVSEAASAIRNQSLFVTDYVRALFSRMDRVESSVHAWVTVDRESVLAEAAACDTEVRDNRFRGPLHGIPIGIKDIFFTKNLRTTMGSPVFANFVPE